MASDLNRLTEGWAQPLDDARTYHYFAGLQGLGGSHFRSICGRHLISISTRLLRDPLYFDARASVRVCKECGRRVIQANQASRPSPE